MDYRPLILLGHLLIGLVVGASALAADSGPSLELQNDWQQRLDQAATLQAEAKERQAEADKILLQTSTDCFRKFLVNACRNQAQTEHTVSSRAAKRLENEGKGIERAVKKEQLQDKDRRRVEQAPQREAERQTREEETAALRQASQAEQAATLSDKARKAEEGAQRKAAEAEKHRQKQAAHDARVAKKIEKAERRSAEETAQK